MTTETMMTEIRPPDGATEEERRAWFCEQVEALGDPGTKIADHFRTLPTEEFVPTLRALYAFGVALQGVEATLPAGEDRDLVIREIKCAFAGEVAP